MLSVWFLRVATTIVSLFPKPEGSTLPSHCPLFRHCIHDTIKHIVKDATLGIQKFNYFHYGSFKKIDL